MLWRHEELLKQHYSSFLNLLRTMLDFSLPQTKLYALRCCGNLLSSAPECESTLLSMLVNKLGDPHPKPAAAAAHNLRTVLSEHPAMSAVVCREVQQLAFRPNLSSQGIYNCAIFLNQVAFTRGEPELPTSLLETYFKLFAAHATPPSCAFFDALFLLLYWALAFFNWNPPH